MRAWFCCGCAYNEQRDVHVVLNRRKERLQPFIRGRVRKIASKNLPRKRGVSALVPRQDQHDHTLKPGVSSIFSCAAGGTPFSVTGAAGASDIGEQGTGGGECVG